MWIEAGEFGCRSRPFFSRLAAKIFCTFPFPWRSKSADIFQQHIEFCDTTNTGDSSDTNMQESGKKDDTSREKHANKQRTH